MTNRVITEEDRANAARLKKLWERKKRELSLTQVALAHKMGYSSQSMISQLLSAKVALNTDAVLRLAEILQVTPGEIDPSLSGLTITRTKLRHIKVPVLARLSGETPNPFEVIEVATTMTRQVYAVSVDIDGFEPFAKRGSTLIISQQEEPIHGDDVFIRLRTANGILQLIKQFVATDHERKIVVVRGINDSSKEELPLRDIETLDPVISVERPIVNRPVRLHTDARAL